VDKIQLLVSDIILYSNLRLVFGDLPTTLADCGYSCVMKPSGDGQWTPYTSLARLDGERRSKVTAGFLDSFRRVAGAGAAVVGPKDPSRPSPTVRMQKSETAHGPCPSTHAGQSTKESFNGKHGHSPSSHES
jgi:hypothetical protein